jgi:hypothetical protein
LRFQNRIISEIKIIRQAIVAAANISIPVLLSVPPFGAEEAEPLLVFVLAVGVVTVAEAEPVE